MGIRTIRLNYRKSCYLSAVNHVIYYNRLRDPDWIIEERGKPAHGRVMNEFLKRISTKNCSVEDVINYPGEQRFILNNKFIKKYADKIEDPDIVDMILQSEYTKDDMKLYFTMKFGAHE